MSVAAPVEVVPKVRGAFYRPELDVLRFCAALMVFVVHAFHNFRTEPHASFAASLLANAVNTGGFGVDLFFVISAFLITQLLFREREQTGTLDVRAFYIRRILRIWPLYFFFIGLACVVISTTGREQHVNGWYVLGLLLLVGNWMPLFGVSSESIMTQVLWSICVEEQFYLIWPRVVRHARIRVIVSIACGMLILGTLVRGCLAWYGRTDWLWTNSFARLDPFAVGILLAIYVRRPLQLNHAKRILLVLTAGACWVLVARFVNPQSHVTLPVAVIGYPVMTFGSALLLLAAFGAPDAGYSLFANKKLAYLGKISYGIYIYHTLSLSVARRFLGMHSEIVNAIFSFTLTLALAMISYRFLESPFLRLKERFAHVQSRPV